MARGRAAIFRPRIVKSHNPNSLLAARNLTLKKQLHFRRTTAKKTGKQQFIWRKEWGLNQCTSLAEFVRFGAHLLCQVRSEVAPSVLTKPLALLQRRQAHAVCENAPPV
jgi:hypothetical protein